MCAFLNRLLLSFKVIKKCRDDEEEHHDKGLEHDAEQVHGCSEAYVSVFAIYVSKHASVLRSNA